MNSCAFAASLVALVATILTAAGFASAISPAYSAERGHGPVQGGRREPPGPVHALAEPDDAHLAGHVRQRSRVIATRGTSPPFGLI